MSVEVVISRVGEDVNEVLTVQYFEKVTNSAQMKGVHAVRRCPSYTSPFDGETMFKTAIPAFMRTGSTVTPS